MQSRKDGGGTTRKIEEEMMIQLQLRNKNVSIHDRAIVQIYHND